MMAPKCPNIFRLSPISTPAPTRIYLKFGKGMHTQGGQVSKYNVHIIRHRVPPWFLTDRCEYFVYIHNNKNKPPRARLLGRTATL